MNKPSAGAALSKNLKRTPPAPRPGKVCHLCDQAIQIGDGYRETTQGPVHGKCIAAALGNGSAEG